MCQPAQPEHESVNHINMEESIHLNGKCDGPAHILGGSTGWPNQHVSNQSWYSPKVKKQSDKVSASFLKYTLLSQSILLYLNIYSILI